jgi:peptidoglycan/xylan/chitin deacetylase (PgdA/CDA1 family)
VRFRPIVLCYHAASERWEDHLAVPPPLIERHARALLGRGLRPLRAEETLENPSRSFHVTFDDAYRNIAGVLGALRRLGVPATVFACTGFAESGGELDVPELEGRAEGVSDELKTMDWNELRALVENGVEVGSHTVTHPHLTELDDRELTRELRESRQRIEAELGRPCRFISYPYGHDDPRVHAAARAAGYEAAFSLERERWRFDRYALPRVDIHRMDRPARFTLKTSRLLPAIRALRSAFANG